MSRIKLKFSRSLGLARRGLRVQVLQLAVLLFLSVSAAPELSAVGARQFKSGPIQITADGRWVWLVNTDNDSVSRVDTANDQVSEWRLPSVLNGGRHSPRGLSVTEDGSEVWVACHDSDSLFVLDGRSGAVLTRIGLAWGSGPHSLAFSRDQSTVLVTLLRRAEILLIDAPTRRIRHRLGGIPEAPM